MKQLIQISFASSVLFSGAALAVNPIQGFYGGLLSEGSRGPDLTFGIAPTLTFAPGGIVPIIIPLTNATVSFNTLGGGGGAVLGYRIQNFRVEGEVLYNRISYSMLKTGGGCNIQTPGIATPTGTCPATYYNPQGTIPTITNTLGLGFDGSASGIYGMINGFYDFITYDGESNWAPYLGLGIGYARITNSARFYYNNIQLGGLDAMGSSTAAQGIIGISYFMDDYMWASLDYRYLTTNTINLTENTNNTNNSGNPRYALNTINLSVNFSFDNSSQ